MAKKTFEDIKPWDGTNGTGSQARAIIKANFAKVNEAFDEITAEIKTKVGSGIQKGMSVFWDLNLGPIPDGFVLSDGNGGAKINGVTILDQRGRFIIGYDPAKFSIPVDDSTGIENYGKVGNTGGANSLKLTIDQLPKHSFKIMTSQTGDNTSAPNNPEGTLEWSSVHKNGNQDYDGKVKNAVADLGKTNDLGGDKAFDNRPLYITACMITKVTDDVTGGGQSVDLSNYYTKVEIDEKLINIPGGYPSITKEFSPTVIFDVKDQFMKVTQNEDINITLSTTGNIENSNATIAITPDNVHALSISNDFFVFGVLDKIQFNILNIYYSTSGIKPICKIVNIPIFIVLSAPAVFTASVVGQVINLAWSSSLNSTKYIIQRSTLSNFSSNVSTVYVGSALSFSDFSGLVPNTTYYYRISAQAYGYTDSALNTCNAMIELILANSYNILSADQSAVLANDSSFDFSNSGSTDKPFTIATRVKIESGQRMYISRSTSSGRAYTVDINVNTLLSLSMLSSNGGYMYKTSTDGITNGIWQHIAVSYDGSRTLSGIKLYVNGVLQTSFYHNDNSSFIGIVGTGHFVLGSDLAQSLQGVFKVSNMIIANRVLTDSEITFAFNNNVNINLSTASFYSDLIAYLKLNGDLNDYSATGIHDGSAIAPNYSTDV